MSADLNRLCAALEAAIGPNAPYPTEAERAAHQGRSAMAPKSGDDTQETSRGRDES